tara:strand:- start:545 stop:811 length:267 start_codon:yes stop_codon:yes gene_type:complete
MGDFSLNILLYVFFIVPDWSVELKAKHSLYMDILRLGEKMGVEFAFPTQTLHLYNEDKVSNPEPTKSPKELLSDGMSTLKNEKFDPII